MIKAPGSKGKAGWHLPTKNLNNMKNLLKKINVFGLALILIGGLAITTQSAFTTANSATKSVTAGHYALNSLDQWVPVNYSLINQEEPGGYTCDNTPSERICSGYFNTQPTSSTDQPDSDEENGDYTPYQP